MAITLPLPVQQAHIKTLYVLIILRDSRRRRPPVLSA